MAVNTVNSSSSLVGCKASLQPVTVMQLLGDCA